MANNLWNKTHIEGKKCFEYFYELGGNAGNNSLMPDRYPSGAGMCSIAATGFYLSAMVAGVELGYIAHDSAMSCVEQCMQSVLHLPCDHGFFYHFYNGETGDRYNNCEISTIDTALLIAGAICAGQYFGGAVGDMADMLYGAVQWSHFADDSRKMFFMAKHNDKFVGQWDVYGEQLLLYVLSVNCPNTNYRVSPSYYYNFARDVGSYDEYTFRYSWFGSLFTHQYSHAFVDFANLKDKADCNWHDNSVLATLANRQYCIDNAHIYDSYGKNSWGLTACAVQGGYEGRIGCAPSGNGNIEHLSMGYVAPCGAIGSIIFTPRLSQLAIRHYYTIDGLCGQYGLKDSFDTQWVADDYISIDKGISLAMIANYYNGCIQRNFVKHPAIASALDILGFSRV